VSNITWQFLNFGNPTGRALRYIFACNNETRQQNSIILAHTHVGLLHRTTGAMPKLWKRKGLFTAHKLNSAPVTEQEFANSSVNDCSRDGHGLGPFMGWVGLGWMRSTVIFYCILCLLLYCVLRKFANNTSNANAVYRQSTRYSCFTEESWVSIGLEFGVQWVEVFTATWQSVNHKQKPDIYFIKGHVKIWVLQYWCLHFT